LGEKRQLFVRPASGLVREVSTSKSLFFGIGVTVATELVWLTALITYGPSFLVAGWNSIAWGALLCFVFLAFVLGPIYAYMVTALPRSGGEQVFTTRIIHPFLGFLETWTWMFGTFSLMAWLVIMTTTSLSSSFWIMGISAAAPWSSYSTWLQGTNGELVAGTIIMAFVFLISMQPSRRFHNINSILVVGGIVLALIVVPFALTLNYTSFATNLQSITGMSVQQVLAAAASGGFSVGTFDVTVIGPLLGFVLFEYAGLNYSGLIAGELKGNLTRNMLISTVGTCVVVLLIHTVYLQIFVNGVGYNLLASLSYLFVSTPSTAPLAPTAQVLVAISNPELAGLMAISALAAVLMLMACMVVNIVVLSRTAFAWAIDRLIPTRLSKINTRTKTPLQLTVIFAVIWYATFLLSLYGVNYVTGVYAYLMLSAMFWIVPGFNAILLPYRRPDIYELLPLSMRKKFGIPLIAIFGVVWLAFIVSAYSMFCIWPLIGSAASLHAADVITFAISQGVFSFVIVFVAGIVVYFVSKWYNRSRGIDMDLLFKTIPPE
jgi:amino acid transporter